ncbi:MAG: NrdH-redoxin [Ignavibacteria bacterium GWF2_33_9]|nr:MAG: NrdH-redoxin [Ignavibacteria bacterium GWF2_33_9]
MEQTVKVIVFSTPTCFHCNNLKRYLKEKNIKFKDIDVSKDRAAALDMQKRTNGNTGVPVVLINNRPIIGFDKSKINKFLNIN